MDIDPSSEPIGPERDDARLAAVRHLFRNQIQAMTSLVGLFGRRLAPGEGRDAFHDLRARFEAATFGPSDEAAPDADGRFAFDLADVARRMFGHLDADFRHRLVIEGEPVSVTPKRAATLAQIIAELVIDVVRNGFGDKGSGSASLTIAAGPDGALTIRMSQVASADAAPRRNPSDLGLSIADSLVRSIGGTVRRADHGPLSTEVSVPAEDKRR